MANKPLQSIKFPGLSDTYVVPQIDDTLSIKGRPADAKETGDKIEAINSDLQTIVKSEGVLTNVNMLPTKTLVNGSFLDANGLFSERTDYVAYPDLIDVSLISLIGSFTFVYTGTTNLTVHFVFYGENTERLSNQNILCVSDTPVSVTIPSGCKYVAISGTHSYQVTIDPNNYLFRVYKEYTNITTDDKINKIRAYNSLVYLADWSNRIYFFGVGTRSTSANRIGLSEMFQPKANYYIFCDDGYSCSVGEFSSAIEGLENEKGNTGWVSSAYLKKDGYYLINFRKNDNSDITVDVGNTNGKIHFYALLDTSISDNYIIGSAFEKTPIQFDPLGKINGYQSFCIYGGKYYCTDGSYIYVYDDFELEQTVSVSIGHGNAMQLGTAHPNYAYISGWNDDTVYVVDLDNIEVVDTIALPSNCVYTTVAVDDVNEIAYIFNGSSTSVTAEDYYDFIVYDYANAQIVSSKKITRKFGAMQACDFVDGLIFALNGMGTSGQPNGYRIYNTSGDIIGEYILGSFSSNEPEGIFVNRETKDVFIMYVNKNVYQIKMV